jgi:Family of unknown function (DUF6188)
MYGLSADLDISPLIGLTLMAVNFTKYNLYLHFYRDHTQCASLHIESSIKVTSRGIEGPRAGQDNNYVEHASALIDCLEVSISSVKIPDSQTLRLDFSNGTSIEIYEDFPQYEAFTLTIDGRTIIV